MNGVTCRFKTNGVMARSQKLRIDGKYYYFNSDGSMTRAQWVDIAGVRYRSKKDGTMAQNQRLLIDGKYYTFDENGALTTK